MPERYLLHLNDPDGGHGMLARVEGDRIGPARSLECSSVQIPPGAALDVLLPAAWCTLLKVRIPTRARAQALKALAFAAEEQLASDPEQLDLVLGARADAAGDWPVLAVDRQARAGLLAVLESTGLRPARLVCEIEAVPPGENGSWQVLPLADRVLVRCAAHEGFSVPGSDLGTWLAAMDVDAAQPLNVLVASDQQQAAEACVASLEGRFAVQVEQTGSQALALLAAGLARGTPLNAFAPPPDRLLRRAWTNWGVVAGLALAVGLVIAIEDVLRTEQALARNAVLQEQVETLFRQALPEAQRMVNPRVQIEQALASMDGSGHGAGFLELLAALGDGWGDDAQLQLERVEYGARGLETSVSAARYADIEALRARLRKLSGIDVELAGSRASEGQSEARILIRPGGQS
ncbi:MAG: type II secretion system protein GspL [Halothiobacillaceae bacterium]